MFCQNSGGNRSEILLPLRLIGTENQLEAGIREKHCSHAAEEIHSRRCWALIRIILLSFQRFLGISRRPGGRTSMSWDGNCCQRWAQTPQSSHEWLEDLADVARPSPLVKFALQHLCELQGYLLLEREDKELWAIYLCFHQSFLLVFFFQWTCTTALFQENPDSSKASAVSEGLLRKRRD